MDIKGWQSLVIAHLKQFGATGDLKALRRAQDAADVVEMLFEEARGRSS